MSKTVYFMLLQFYSTENEYEPNAGTALPPFNCNSFVIWAGRGIESRDGVYFYLLPHTLLKQRAKAWYIRPSRASMRFIKSMFSSVSDDRLCSSMWSLVTTRYRQISSRHKLAPSIILSTAGQCSSATDIFLCYLTQCVLKRYYIWTKCVVNLTLQDIFWLMQIIILT